MQESIMVNREKLLLLFGIPAEHQGRAVRHGDAVVPGMKAGRAFDGEDICKEIENSSKGTGRSPEYAVSDWGHNLVKGISMSGLAHHADISYAMGNCLKHAYEKEPDFMALTALLGKVRLQYHLTDKAYLLPPNMRSIARFINMSCWVDWGIRMLDCYDSLSGYLKEAYSFIPENKELLEELHASVEAVRHVETICKNEEFNMETSRRCKSYIVRHVIGNAHNRRSMLGINMLEYFKKEEAMLLTPEDNHNISSDIIESNFGIYKAKKSPNKLYGITPFVLLIPLHSKLENDSAAETFDFKERLCDVKLKDVDAFAKQHMSTNWVTERTKTLKKVS